jgi:hypothetical protein
MKYTITYRMRYGDGYVNAIDRTEWSKQSTAVSVAKERMVNRDEPTVAWATIYNANGKAVKVVEWSGGKPIARKPHEWEA